MKILSSENKYYIHSHLFIWLLSLFIFTQQCALYWLMWLIYRFSSSETGSIPILLAWVNIGTVDLEGVKETLKRTPKIQILFMVWIIRKQISCITCFINRVKYNIWVMNLHKWPVIPPYDSYHMTMTSSLKVHHNNYMSPPPYTISN